ALVLDQATSAGFFVRVQAGAVPIHVIAGLGGGVTITTFGVSYRFLGVFMLSPDVDATRGPTTPWLAAAPPCAAGGGGPHRGAGGSFTHCSSGDRTGAGGHRAAALWARRPAALSHAEAPDA